ncbi:hypothetical protein LDENG_00050090 [Lucifuga dentata]|nr:hypothetical protein LDENG_00050090 [Lucifuga dentata]
MLKLSLWLLLLSHSACAILLGWVESPGYPTGYTPHASLNWSRCAPKGHTLSLKIIHLDMEDSQDCENDALKIFSNGNVISVLCGKREFEELQSTVNPVLVSTPGGCLSLSFHSDYSNTKRHIGFRGFYTVQDFDECKEDPENGCTQFCHNFIGGYYCSCRHGYHLDVDKHTCTVSCTEDLSGLHKGKISSPSWPHQYAENSNCLYTLSVEAHLQLELHFSKDFDIEQTPDGQCIDSLTVETPSRTLGPFCGHTPPPSPLSTYSNRVQIHFMSDGFGSNKGFSLHYTTRGKVCLGVTSNSNVAPLQPEYHPGETVRVTCDFGYLANTPGTDAMSSEYITTCQKTGEWSPVYICEIVDCGFPPIENDNILQLVGSGDQSTQYEDKIKFECNSKYYKLEGDDTYICNGNGVWVSEKRMSSEMPKCTEVCGKTEANFSSTGRILGGEEAKLNEIPWQLLTIEPRGGASLINDRWAVTAAHVVEGLEETSLHLYGGLLNSRKARNMSAEPDLQSNAVIIESEKIIIHPSYIRNVRNLASLNRNNFDNDIALIRFTKRVKLGPSLLPICLPAAQGSFVENEQECENTPIMSKNKRGVFTDNMFCAGAQGKDSCRGDSGGPFFLPMLGSGNTQGRGPYRLTGIVSWGLNCQKQQYKGYYTKVENYVDWIQETMDKTEKALR